MHMVLQTFLNVRRKEWPEQVKPSWFLVRHVCTTDGAHMQLVLECCACVFQPCDPWVHDPQLCPRPARKTKAGFDWPVLGTQVAGDLSYWLINHHNSIYQGTNGEITIHLNFWIVWVKWSYHHMGISRSRGTPKQIVYKENFYSHWWFVDVV